MLKLSHNPRFRELEEIGLQCKWDAIVTSSQWLADVCEQPPVGWNYAPQKATRIGWFHYNFQSMRRNPKRKLFRPLGGQEPVVIATLVHGHASKGTTDACQILHQIKRIFGDQVHIVGIGEVPSSDVRIDIPGFEYLYAPSRDELAEIFQKTDVWLGCSHTEGLGRMALEAMSCSAACVLTDTGAEFVRNGDNALTAPVGDIASLTLLVQDIINNIELRRQVGSNGFETAKRKADPTDFGDRLEKVIHDIF